MSTAALFDDDSSDDEEFDDKKTDEAKDNTPKRTIKMDDDGEDDDDSGDKGKGKEASNDDEDGDDAKGVAKSSQGVTANEDAPAATAPKSKPTTSELFGDSSDDDDEGEAKLDDVVGSFAPPGAKKKTAVPSASQDGDEDDMMANSTSGLEADTDTDTAVVAKPPDKAIILESSRPSKDVSVHMSKLPNLVAIQPAAFDEDVYLEKEEEDQYRGYVHNMIRWRYKRNSDGALERQEDGSLIRESNSRFVQWSDGSFTLHVGKEVFDVQSTDSSSKGFAGLNGYVYLSQKAIFSNEGEDDDAPGSTVLECIAPVASRFVPKPSSLQSDSHKSLTIAVRQKTIKKARIAEYVTQEDPEVAKATRIRNKEDLDKAMARKSTGAYRPSSGPRYRSSTRSRHMEDDDDDGDYDTTNIRALKKGSGMDDDMDDFGDESDDDDDDGYNDTFRKGRERKRRKKDEEDEEELAFEEEEEEEGTLIKAHKKTNRSRQAVVDDDDEED